MSNRSSRSSRGNATDDIEQGFSRKNASGPRRTYKIHRRVESEVAHTKGVKQAEYAQGLLELHEVSYKLKTQQDKKDLNDMIENLAENMDKSLNSNGLLDRRALDRLKELIRFWNDKADMSQASRSQASRSQASPSRIGGRRTKRKIRRGKKTRRR